MEHIMNYKIYLYVFFVMLSAFSLTGINYDKWLKTNKIWEARILVVLLSFIMGYLLTLFVVDFLTVSKIF